ncbi:MAG: preprotein translocase subunit SecE [Desulfonatronovibrionaceae bacterium]
MGKKKKSATVQPEAPAGMKGRVQQFKEFLEQAKVELKKVTWPSRKETLTTGAAVAVLVAIVSVFLGLADFTLAKIVELVLS